MVAKNYFESLEREFQRNANQKNAFFMKKYMKDKFEYFGIKTPKRRELLKAFLKEFGKPSNEDLKKYIKYLWNKPQREFQYAALNLLDNSKKYIYRELIDFLEYLITTKSWWDTVDGIASNHVGLLFSKFPELIKPYTEKWMNSGNIWLQRTVILFQLKYKEKTDEKLLYKYIKELSSADEFFIQKAIGWTLREYSKTNPESVEKFIGINKLAPLSVREGMKIINKQK
ncbi:DNA alkylation repair protein [Bacteroidota bacterium]